MDAAARLTDRLNQHWFTDVVGGVILGVMFLLVAIATIRAFDPDPRQTDVGVGVGVVAD